MTKFKLFLITLCLTTTTLYGQVPWDISGNGGTNDALNFVGTLNSQDLRFRTDNTFRLGIKGSNGWLGLNTTTPAGRFHQRHGDFIVETNLLVNEDGDVLAA